jgi:K+-sensing histidine kinase KdpD
MTASDLQPASSGDSIKVEWTDVVGFVRQLSHDLRNHLNAAELQSAYLAEITSDPEMKDEIKRLRQMIAVLGTTLQKLSASVAQAKPNLMPYRASDFVEDLRRKIETDFPKEGASVAWDIQAGDASLEIDPQLMQQAGMELFANAFRHAPGKGPITVSARSDGGQFVLVLQEPKENFDLATENWGREPLRSVHHGHYGLGLNLARVIVESHGGHLSAQHDNASGTLVTTIALPLGGGNK